MDELRVDKSEVEISLNESCILSLLHHVMSCFQGLYLNILPLDLKALWYQSILDTQLKSMLSL